MVLTLSFNSKKLYILIERIIFLKYIDDPEERNNIAEKEPNVTQRLMDRLKEFIPQMAEVDMSQQVLDASAKPSLFGGVWTPWK